jgi:hypothetical protein
MDDQMEFMCLECGVSNYLHMEGLAFDDLGGPGGKIVRNAFCAECGGPLSLIGKAGDEPYYRLKE